MTFKEKLKEEYPEKVDEDVYGGCEGCPFDYGYEVVNLKCKETDCVDCWNRETEGSTTKNISEEFNTFVCDKCLVKIEDFVEVETLLDIYGVEYEDAKDYKFKFCPECGRKVVE